MSIQFNDTSTYKGLVQIYEKECGFNRGDISGDNDKLKDFAADVNLALDDFFLIGFRDSGTWQLDDSNYVAGSGDFPFVRTSLVSGQRDYSFITDGYSNLILDIHRVMIADSSGIYREIEPVDQQTRNSNNVNTDSLIDGRNSTGTPTRYEKTGNGILLDPIPNYNYSSGLKIFINREPSYFSYDATTKKPGVPGLLHRYFAIKPALDYARRNTLKNYTALANEVLSYEGDKDRGLIGKIARAFGAREKDVRKRMQANVESTK